MSIHLSAEIWAITGIALIIADVLTSTFVLAFFGIGSLVAALTTWLNLSRSTEGQFLVFSITSILSMLLFRKAARERFGRSAEGPEYSEFIGERARVAEPIPPKSEGRVEFRGTEWIAFSDTDTEIPEGSIVTIVAVEGIRLKVRLER